jgi:hypothetical protein
VRRLTVKELILLENNCGNFAKLEEKSSTEGSLYFVAFAPDNPKFIAILVENGGFEQHCWTAASLMIENTLERNNKNRLEKGF